MNDVPPPSAPTFLASRCWVRPRGGGAPGSALDRIGLSVAKFGVLAKLVEAGEPLALGSLAEAPPAVCGSNMTQASWIAWKRTASWNG